MVGEYLQPPPGHPKDGEFLDRTFPFRARGVGAPPTSLPRLAQSSPSKLGWEWILIKNFKPQTCQRVILEWSSLGGLPPSRKS